MGLSLFFDKFLDLADNFKIIISVFMDKLLQPSIWRLITVNEGNFMGKTGSRCKINHVLHWLRYRVVKYCTVQKFRISEWVEILLLVDIQRSFK